MQFALVESKPVQAGPNAPCHAQCIYCSQPVMLRDSIYIHSVLIGKCHCYSRLKDAECQKLRDRGQEELDKVLNVNR